MCFENEMVFIFGSPALRFTSCFLHTVCACMTFVGVCVYLCDDGKSMRFCFWDAKNFDEEFSGFLKLRMFLAQV